MLTRNPSGTSLDHGTGGHEFVQGDLEVLADALVDGDVALGHDRGHRPGPGHDPVRDCPVGHRVQRVDPLDLQGRGADPVDLGAHLDQHLADVDDLRFARRVVDDGGALGQDRRHQQVLGGPDAREVQPDRRPVQLAGLGDQETVLAGHLRTEPGAGR